MNNFYRYQYYRGTPPRPVPPPKCLEPSPKPVSPPKPPAPLKPPPHRSPKPKPPKKKFDFKSFQKNTCTSLNDVECFLNRFSNTWKYIRLIKLLK